MNSLAMSKDIENGYQLYYDEQHDEPCFLKCRSELFQHPFTLLDVNGYIIDVKRTFATSPIHVVLPVKLLALGITIDVMVRDIQNYPGTLSIYLAYFEQWALVFSLFYFLLSSLLSMIPLAPQPSPQENRAPFMVCLTWAVYPLALLFQTLYCFAYWSLVYDQQEGVESLIRPTLYLTMMKNFGILVTLIGEGQFVNRIPLRFSHLIIAEMGLAAYIIWTMLHDATNIGNPNRSNDSINLFLNWSKPNLLKESALESFIMMAFIAPAVWFVYYIISWPCRRYMPFEVDGEVVVDLPQGFIGVKLTGKPPRVTDIMENSPIRSEIGVGLVVDTLTLEDGEKCYQLDANELNNILNKTSKSNGRIMRFINHDILPLTKEPSGEDEVLVRLPAGLIGVVLTGKPPRVVRISENSSIGDQIREDLVVDTLILEDGRKYYQLDSTELIHMLKVSSHSHGRIIRFINNDVLSLTEEPSLGDEVIVPLPAGSIGLKLRGKPPRIVGISENSAIGDQIREDLVVDTLTLEDGKTYYQLDSTKLIDLLKDNSDSHRRIIRFINHEVLSLTEEPVADLDIGFSSVALDERKEDGALVVSLPAGSIGLFFNKAVPPMITKIKETSPLLYSGLQVGMCVDTLTIAATGEIHYHLEAKEFISHLKQYRDLDGGRIVRFIQNNMPVSNPR